MGEARVLPGRRGRGDREAPGVAGAEGLRRALGGGAQDRRRPAAQGDRARGDPVRESRAPPVAHEAQRARGLPARNRLPRDPQGGVRREPNEGDGQALRLLRRPGTLPELAHEPRGRHRDVHQPPRVRGGPRGRILQAVLPQVADAAGPLPRHGVPRAPDVPFPQDAARVEREGPHRLRHLGRRHADHLDGRARARPLARRLLHARARGRLRLQVRTRLERTRRARGRDQLLRHLQLREARDVPRHDRRGTGRLHVSARRHRDRLQQPQGAQADHLEPGLHARLVARRDEEGHVQGGRAGGAWRRTWRSPCARRA